jgi:hypothetical protein
MGMILIYVIDGYAVFIVFVGAIVLFKDTTQRLTGLTDAESLMMQSGKVFGDLGESRSLNENTRTKMDRLLAMHFPVSYYAENREGHIELRSVLQFTLQVRRANDGIYARSGLKV